MESDEALYQRLLAGHLAAFDGLYQRYERRLFGFVRAQLGDDAEAEDVFHEAFLAVLDARAARTELRSFKAWLFEVARHRCLNRLRSRARGQRALEAAAREPSDSSGGDGGGSGREAALSSAVARLPDRLAELYHLRASGLSYDEVSTVLALPIGTVKSRMHQLVKRLRDELAEEN